MKWIKSSGAQLGGASNPCPELKFDVTVASGNNTKEFTYSA